MEYMGGKESMEDDAVRTWVRWWFPEARGAHEADLLTQHWREEPAARAAARADDPAGFRIEATAFRWLHLHSATDTGIDPWLKPESRNDRPDCGERLRGGIMDGRCEPVEGGDQGSEELRLGFVSGEPKDDFGSERGTGKGDQVATDSLTAADECESGKRQEIAVVAEVELSLAFGERLQHSSEPAARAGRPFGDERADAIVGGENAQYSAGVPVCEGVEDERGSGYRRHFRA